MQRTQPQALTNDELLHHAYTLNYNVSVDYVKEICERFSELLSDQGHNRTTDPRQLELPL